MELLQDTHIVAVNAEDSLFFATRFQFGDVGSTLRRVNNIVNSITGCLITDTRHVYDKLSTEVICTKGTERRVDIELMGLKPSQLRSTRWAHSDAQLSTNSLTKNEQRQLLL